MTEIIRVSRFLRNVLSADAATCTACALLLTFGAGFLQNVSGLPYSLLFYAGLSLFPFAAFFLYVAACKSVSKSVVWLIIGLNLLWTIDSLLLIFSGYVAPTAFGYVFVIAQAIGVSGFAALQFIALKNCEIVVFKDAKQTI